MAILICLSIIATSITLFIWAGDSTEQNDKYDLKSPDQQLNNAFNICFGIHSVAYVCLVLLMICTMVQITIGLKRQYDRCNKPNATDIAKRNVRIAYASCILVFLISATAEIVPLIVNIEPIWLQSWYLVLSAGLFGAYGISLYYLFSYMNTEENPALRPEHSKMAWQAAYYMLSLAIFFTVKLLVLAKVIKLITMFILMGQATVFFTDILPLAYVIYCHDRIFSRNHLNTIPTKDHTETMKSMNKSYATP